MQAGKLGGHGENVIVRMVAARGGHGGRPLYDSLVLGVRGLPVGGPCAASFGSCLPPLEAPSLFERSRIRSWLPREPSDDAQDEQVSVRFVLVVLVGRLVRALLAARPSLPMVGTKSTPLMAMWFCTASALLLIESLHHLVECTPSLGQESFTFAILGLQHHGP